MFRPELSPQLLNEQDVEDPVLREHFRKFNVAVQDQFRRNAIATRQMQSPPVVRMRKLGAANQSLAAGVAEVVTFDESEIDTHGWWDSSSNWWNARETGYYRYSAQARFTTFSAAPTVCRLTMIVDNVAHSRVDFPVTATTQSPVLTITGLVKVDGVSAVDEFQLEAECTLADATIDGTHVYTSLNIEFIGADQIR
jgi:hypothetical protein